MNKRVFKVALCQLKTIRDKESNIKKATEMIKVLIHYFLIMELIGSRFKWSRCDCSP